MIRRRSRMRDRRHTGATLVETLLALVVLLLILISVMGVMIATTQRTVAAKETMGVSLASWSELERTEARRLSDDISGSAASDTGGYMLDRKMTPGGVKGSATIGVTAKRDGGRLFERFMTGKTLERKVSPSAWQNAGELP